MWLLFAQVCRSVNNCIGFSHLLILVKNIYSSYSKCLTKAETQVHEQRETQLSLTNHINYTFLQMQ